MRIKPMTRVSTEAWRFDDLRLDIRDRWSFGQFGDNHMNTRVFGTVQKKCGGMWKVVWDDGESTTIRGDYLTNENVKNDMEIIREELANTVHTTASKFVIFIQTFFHFLKL